MPVFEGVTVMPLSDAQIRRTKATAKSSCDDGLVIVLLQLQLPALRRLTADTPYCCNYTLP